MAAANAIRHGMEQRERQRGIDSKRAGALDAALYLSFREAAPLELGGVEITPHDLERPARLPTVLDLGYRRSL
jgi:hypothetical protein